MDSKERAREVKAHKELLKLCKAGQLKIPTNIHRCHGLTNELFPYYSPEDIIHPDDERFRESKCDDYKYDLKSMKHIVLHEVVSVSPLDNSYRATAYSPKYEVDGHMTHTMIVGQPTALLVRLTEWDS